MLFGAIWYVIAFEHSYQCSKLILKWSKCLQLHRDLLPSAPSVRFLLSRSFFRSGFHLWPSKGSTAYQISPGRVAPAILVASFSKAALLARIPKNLDRYHFFVHRTSIVSRNVFLFSHFHLVSMKSFTWFPYFFPKWLIFQPSLCTYPQEYNLLLSFHKCSHNFF